MRWPVRLQCLCDCRRCGRSSGRRRGRIPAAAEIMTVLPLPSGAGGFNSLMGNPVFVKRIATGAGSSIRFGRSGGRKFGRPAKRDARQGTRCPLMMGSPTTIIQNKHGSFWRGRRREKRFDLQKDFEWSLGQSHPVVQSLDQSRRHKDRPASLDLAPLGRSVPMPKHPMQCKCVQAHLWDHLRVS